MRYAADRQLAVHEEADVRRHFEEVLHSPVTIEFEKLEEIPRAASGKFMTAIRDFPYGDSDRETIA
jgi:hypothetical protein